MKIWLAAKQALQNISDSLFGYDFFISYSHADGEAYGKQLAAELRHLGYSVFLDADVYTAGTDPTWADTGDCRTKAALILNGMASTSITTDDGRITFLLPLWLAVFRQ